MSRRDAISLVAGATAGLLVAGSETNAEEKKVPPAKFDYDVVIVGGGPSGLSAALVLGRACRKVLVCDEGKPRNHASPAVHGYFTRDGISPAELLKVGREQLKPYAVEWRAAGVTDAEKLDGGFRVELRDGKVVTARKLILATGVRDELPDIEGLSALWGTGVLHCPYCHGWEVRNKPWAFMGPPEAAVERATLFLGWTKTLTYLTNGPVELTADQTKWLAARQVAVRKEKVVKLDGKDGKLTAVVFLDDRRLEVAALFVHSKSIQRSDLPKRMGCKFVTDGRQAGMVETDAAGATTVAGLYVVGDASATGMMSVVGAVADGAATAGAANMTMLKEDAERA